MDLSLYLRVVWRFKLVVLAGLLLGIGLAFLSFVRVDLGSAPHFRYRASEQWFSSTTLIITPTGFPWGRSELSEENDPARYGQLASIYANLATTDAVKQLMLEDGPIRAKIDARPIFASDSSSAPALPLITVSATAASPELAQNTAERATRAFLEYIRDKQEDNGISPSGRVSVSTVKHAVPAELLAGRSKTTAIAIFLAVMIAVIGLAFVLENLRPRVRVVRSDELIDRPRAAAAGEASRRFG
jgi:hypothetical protein